MEKKFQLGSHTDVGQVRQVNEDFIGNFETPNGEVFIVSDGMGGHVGGATASKLAVESIRNFFRNPLQIQPPEALFQSVAFANQQIIRYAIQDPELEGMGATCVVVLLKEEEVFYAHVGDSRLYLLRNGQLSQLTRDHSEVQQLVDNGQLTPESALRHPRKHVLTRALGIETNPGTELAQQPLHLLPGDFLLLCTDGLTNCVTDIEIQRLLLQDLSVQDKARQLVTLANEAGGPDNISVQLIQATAPAVVKSLFDEIPDALLAPSNPIVPKEAPVPVITNAPTYVEKPVENQVFIKNPEPTSSKTEPVENPLATPARKTPDWALIILIALFVGVLALFFSNWDDISDNPKPSELYVAPADTTQPENPAAQEVEPIQNTQAVNANKPDKKPKTDEKTAAEKKPESQKAKKDTIITYTVKEGDNLTRIAERFNLKKATLRKLNGMEKDELKAEQKLKIRVKAVHRVGAGDVLTKVAEKYSVSRDLIKKANEKTENKTTRGEKLIIPVSPTQ